jgi:tartrate-resistant acid phosphatase type 5
VSVSFVAAVTAATLATVPATDDGPRTRFLVKGDWGDASAAQAQVTAAMCDVAAKRHVTAVITTGDNFSAPDGTATTDNWSRPERCLEELDIPFRAAWGNHDLGGTATADVLGSTERFYTFANGPARVVVLDANTPDDPAQTEFLESSLASASEPVRIVAFHQPARTSGIHPPGEAQQRNWEPIMRRHGVSLVLQGHNHLYERIEANGITYVTTGGGGAALNPCVRPTEGLRTCRLSHHFLELDVLPGEIALRAISARGNVIDEAEIRSAA